MSADDSLGTPTSSSELQASITGITRAQRLERVSSQSLSDITRRRMDAEFGEGSNGSSGGSGGIKIVAEFCGIGGCVGGNSGDSDHDDRSLPTQSSPSSLLQVPKPPFLRSQKLKSPSRSSIRRWRQTRGRGLLTCLALRCRGSSTANADATAAAAAGASAGTTALPEEKFPFVQREGRPRPATLLLQRTLDAPPAMATFDDATLLTHMHAHLITDAQCFVVSAAQMKKHKGLKAKLGACVKYKRAPCPPTDPQCKYRCDDCDGVCDHTYACSCPLKFMATKWCAHIHAMHLRTAGAFKEAALLFVHDDWRHTEMRHIRAFIQGADFMRRSDDDELRYDEQCGGARLTWSHIYRVQMVPGRDESLSCHCKPDKRCELCGACACMYACTCPDYFNDHQVCQHIHNVAMQEHARRDQLFAALAEFGGGRSHDQCGPPHALADTSDPNHRYYMEQEHEMSFYEQEVANIAKVTAESPFGDQWRMYSAENKCWVTVRPVPDRKACFCDTDAATKANSCHRCGICAGHYTCSCAKSRFTICRHIHAVVRFELQLEEKPETRLRYIYRIFPVADDDEDEAGIAHPVRLPVVQPNEVLI